jgi:hypothetical protein
MRFALAVLTLAATACGWRAGLPLPSGARTIAVEVARREGDVLERGLEPELTAALSQAVIDWVDLPLVAPVEADLVVRSQVLEYRRRGGVRNTRNELIETAVFVRARAELLDRRTGRVLGEPKEAQEWSGFALDDPQTNEEEAQARALRHVAAALVLELFEDPALSR